MAKYSDFLINQNHPVLSVPSPPTFVLLNPFLRRSRIQEVLKFLEENQSKLLINGCVFYCFSNGGGLLMEATLSELRIKPSCFLHLRRSIKGIIYDSCPGNLSFITAFPAVKERLNSTPLRWKIFGLLFSLGIAMCPMRILVKTLFASTGSSFSRAVRYACVLFLFLLYVWDRRRYEPSYCWPELFSTPLPGLFLFSKNDALVPAENILALVEHRIEMKFPTVVQTFEPSAHVAHFKHHPLQYQQSVYKFVQSIFEIGSVACTQRVAGKPSDFVEKEKKAD